MQYVKLFLASSLVEFAQTRRDLKSFVASLNDIYVRRGIYLELCRCEDFGKALSQDRKQEEYNCAIRQSRYFYLLFGREVGPATLEEFQVALDQFQKQGAPRLYIFYFRDGGKTTPAQSALDFMRRLDRTLNHYFCQYDHPEALELEILMELVRDPALQATLAFRDGQVLLEEEPVLSLENIPLYSKNPAVQQMMARQRALNREYETLTARCEADPEDKDAQRRRREINRQCTECVAGLHRLEADVLALYRQMMDKRENGQISVWERDALQRVDVGAYEEAKAILRDPRHDAELDTACALEALAIGQIRQYISAKRTLIGVLQASGLDRDTVTEILALYEKLADLTRRYHLERKVVCDYLQFLLDQRQISRGIRVGEELCQSYQEQPPRHAVEERRAQNLLAQLYMANRNFEKAEALFRQLLAYYRSNPGERLPRQENLAGSCNNLAVLLDEYHQNDTAKALYQEALTIYRRLVEKDPEKYGRGLANVCNNLAVLLGRSWKKAQAESLYREALAIYRRLAAQKPAVYEPYLAQTCNNLANLLEEWEQREESKALHQEALAIRQRLAEKNPDAYEPALAQSCSNLGNLLEEMENQPEAEALHRRALAIYQRLAEENPDAYEPDLANSCNNLASLLGRTGQGEQAESLYREALAIYRRLAVKNPQVYESDLARTLLNLAFLYCDQEKEGEARDLCREAQPIYERLTAREPIVYWDALYRTNLLLSLLGD